jgi:dihydroxy-acid dehydratase
VLLNLKPSGAHYMEHLHHAGGLPTLLRELSGLLDLSAPNISGGTLGDAIAAAEHVPSRIECLSSMSADRQASGGD